MAIPDPAHADPQSLDDVLLDDLLKEVRESAREQLQAGAQLQLDRLHDQLAAAFQGDLQRILDDLLAEAAARMEAWHRANADRERVAGRHETSERLSQIVRRLRQSESAQQSDAALLDGASNYCQRVALFAIAGTALEFRGARGVETEAFDRVELAAAPAFAAAIETKDTVVAMRTRGEMSDAIATLLGDSTEQRAYLFPVIARDRVGVILCVDAPTETGAIEMLCSVAGAVLEAQAARASDSGNLINIAPARPATWFGLNREEQSLHLRAQRFARVHVAEMRLYKAQPVKVGRAEHNLYGHLTTEIDTCRAAFRKEFLSGSDSMVDYLHVELVRTLANDDADLLGPTYPGPMI